MKNTLKYFWPVLLTMFVIDEVVLLMSKYFSVWWLQLAVVVSLIIALLISNNYVKKTEKEFVEKFGK